MSEASRLLGPWEGQGGPTQLWTVQDSIHLLRADPRRQIQMLAKGRRERGPRHISQPSC